MLKSISFNLQTKRKAHHKPSSSSSVRQNTMKTEISVGLAALLSCFLLCNGGDYDDFTVEGCPQTNENLQSLVVGIPENQPHRPSFHFLPPQYWMNGKDISILDKTLFHLICSVWFRLTWFVFCVVLILIWKWVYIRHRCRSQW